MSLYGGIFLHHHASVRVPQQFVAMLVTFVAPMLFGRRIYALMATTDEYVEGYCFILIHFKEHAM